MFAGVLDRPISSSHKGLPVWKWKGNSFFFLENKKIIISHLHRKRFFTVIASFKLCICQYYIWKSSFMSPCQKLNSKCHIFWLSTELLIYWLLILICFQFSHLIHHQRHSPNANYVINIILIKSAYILICSSALSKKIKHIQQYNSLQRDKKI